MATSDINFQHSLRRNDLSLKPNQKLLGKSANRILKKFNISDKFKLQSYYNSSKYQDERKQLIEMFQNKISDQNQISLNQTYTNGLKLLSSRNQNQMVKMQENTEQIPSDNRMFENKRNTFRIQQKRPQTARIGALNIQNLEQKDKDSTQALNTKTNIYSSQVDLPANQIEEEQEKQKLLISNKDMRKFNMKAAQISEFDSSSIVKTNVHDYLQTTKGHNNRCIGCAKCLSPQHRIIQYKYPQQLHSRYVELFQNQNQNPPLIQVKDLIKGNTQQTNQILKAVDYTSENRDQVFNYDRVRQNLQNSFRREKFNTQNNDQVNGQYQQINKDIQKFAVFKTTNQELFGGDQLEQKTQNIQKHNKETLNYIKNTQKQGNIIEVPVNCFLENTSYRNQFQAISNPQRLQQFRPQDQGTGQSLSNQFKAISMYNQQFSSNLHIEESNGQILKEKTMEQRKKSKETATNQRKGTLSQVQSKIPFNAVSASHAAFSQVFKFQNSKNIKSLTQLSGGQKGYRPFDTLFCPDGIKMIAQSHHNREYSQKNVDLCRFASQRNNFQ